MLPKRISATEVAEKIRLPLRGNILERIDLSLTPYLNEPLSYIGDSEVEWLGIFAPTQSGKSVFLQVAVADAIDQDPGPLFYLLPDETSGKKQVREKIIAMIDNSEFLTQHKTNRKFDVSQKEIILDNMSITTGWAGSLGRMSSTPYKRVVLDEVRLMKLSVGEESNAIKFAGDRLTTYLDMGIGQGYMVSSPSVEGDLLHQQLSVHGTTVLFWHVPCPSCGEYQELDFFKNVKFDKTTKHLACVCKFCGGEFPDTDKKRAWNNKGVYAPKNAKINLDGTLQEPYRKTKRMFFHWSSLESPFRDFKRIWNEYLQTKDKLQDYKNFVQCWLAQFWIDDISKTSVIKLNERQLAYSTKDVPDGVRIIFAGIDTQDDGFYVTVRGFGSDKTTWLIDAFFIACDIHTTDFKDFVSLWDRDIFSRVYSTIENTKWRVALTAIDTGGHRTTELYKAAAHFPNLILVKGKDTQNSTYMYNKDLNLYLVRTCEYLDETEERCQSTSFFLPNDVEQTYKNQFCNVRKQLKVNRTTGEKTIKWVKIGQCDYRFADIHTFILLDIPTSKGVIRSELEKPDFCWNPLFDAKKQAEMRVMARDIDPNDGYEIGSFDWGQ